MMSSWSLILPAPWDAVSRRRGDPLGFQDVAREIADAWAPGISGRQRDARWLTLLCKALSALKNCNDDDKDLYQLMSTFERGVLVAACDDGNKGAGRHLPGKRLARTRWPASYRYYGPWGVYRSLLLTCGLVDEDNPWCLTGDGEGLASLIENHLSLDRRISIDDSWRDWMPRLNFCEPLKSAEQKILGPLLFGLDQNGKTRASTVENLAQPVPVSGFFEKQPLAEDALWFDKFTRACFAVMSEALASAVPGQNIPLGRINLPAELNGVIQKPCNRWPQVSRLAREIVNRPGQEVAVILEWHAKRANKPLFEPMGQVCDFKRVADAKAAVRRSYFYRLWNLWCLAKQIYPSRFKHIVYPQWLEVAADEEDVLDE